MFLYEQQDYMSSLNALVEAEHIVIYCGAGVTLSKTGILWGHLVLKVAEYIKSGLEDNNILTEDQLGELIARLKSGGADSSPLQNASLVSELLAVLAKEDAVEYTPQSKLRDAMTYALYRNSRMRYLKDISETDLLLHVCKLVIRLASAGKKIAVVTTNYDTYLEEGIDLALAGLSEYSPNVPNPLKLRVLSGVEPHVLCDALAKKDEISLIYLHGRAPRKSDASRKQPDRAKILSGDIVFSEMEYSKSAQSTNLLLGECGKFAETFLILGSSMEDPPLLRWLQENKKIAHSLEAGQRDAHCETVILVKALEMEDAQKERVEEKQRKSIVRFDRWRYQHLGINYFIPIRIFSDVPIFLRDAVTTFSLHQSDMRLTKKSMDSLTFSSLSAWTLRASMRLGKEDILRRIYDLLRSQRSVLTDLFMRIFSTKLSAPIIVRLELWIRGVDPCEGNIYRVVRVADSSGMLLSPQMRRSEHLYRRFPSRTSAIRVMQIGRPQIESLSRFGEGFSASRWQGFYSVPMPLSLGSGANASSVIIGSMVVSLGILEVGDTFVHKTEKMRLQDELDILSEKLSGVWAGKITEDELSLLQEFGRIDTSLRDIGQECLKIIAGDDESAAHNILDGDSWT